MLVAFKFPLVATSLIVYCIVRCVFAAHSVDSCKDLLSLELNWSDGDVDGPGNFQRSFTFLSLEQIDYEKFIEPNDYIETPFQRKKRETQYDVTRSYFLDLLTNYQQVIDVSQMNNAYQWCFRITNNDTSEELWTRVIQNPYADCVDFTTKLMSSHTVAEIQPRILENMYNDWAYDDLMDQLGSPTEQFRSESRRLERQSKMQLNVVAYTMKFFEYYESALEGIEDATDIFLSIPDYCETKGRYVIEDHGYNLD